MEGTEGKQHTEEASFVQSVLEAQFPGAFSAPSALGQGMDFRTYLTYNTVSGHTEPTVVRVPQRKSAKRKMAKEMQLLPSLQQFIASSSSTTNLASTIPRYAFVSKEESSGKIVLAGYPLLQGTPLSTSDDACGVTQLEANPGLLEELVALIARVHAFPEEKAIEAGVPIVGSEKNLNNLIEEIVDMKAALLQLRDEKTIEESLHSKIIAFVDDIDKNKRLLFRESTRKPVLLHGDIHFEHILSSQKEGKEPISLLGLLDWSDAELTDPAFEPRYLWAFLPEHRRIWAFDKVSSDSTFEVGHELTLLFFVLGT